MRTGAMKTWDSARGTTRAEVRCLARSPLGGGPGGTGGRKVANNCARGIICGQIIGTRIAPLASTTCVVTPRKVVQTRLPAGPDARVACSNMAVAPFDLLGHTSPPAPESAFRSSCFGNQSRGPAVDIGVNLHRSRHRVSKEVP